jgi:hypothetical protein
MIHMGTQCHEAQLQHNATQCQEAQLQHNATQCHEAQLQHNATQCHEAQLQCYIATCCRHKTAQENSTKLGCNLRTTTPAEIIDVLHTLRCHCMYCINYLNLLILHHLFTTHLHGESFSKHKII